MATPRWEYMARNLKKMSGKALDKDLKELGGDGWELAGLTDGRAIFKRPAPRQAAAPKPGPVGPAARGEKPK